MQGWPLTEASLVFKDRVSDYDGTMTARLREAGAVLVGQTTASEFGGDQLHVHPPARRDLEPLRPGADPRRVLGRLGGVGGGRAAADLHGW